MKQTERTVLLEQSMEWDERLYQVENMIGAAKEACERLELDLMDTNNRYLVRTLNSTRASLYLLQRGIGNAPSPFIQ